MAAVSHLLGCKSICATPGAHLRFRRFRHAAADVLHGALRRHEVVELVLGEEAPSAPGRSALAALRREAPGDELRKSGLAVAVGPEKRDPVVRIDAQIEPLQDRLARFVADAPALDGDDGEATCFSGSRKGEAAWTCLRSRLQRCPSAPMP